MSVLPTIFPAHGAHGLDRSSPVTRPRRWPGAQAASPGVLRRSATPALALAAVLALSLAGCGGGDAPVAEPSVPGETIPLTPLVPADPGETLPLTPLEPAKPVPVPRTLLIDLDGATYAQVQAGIQDGSLPHLAKLDLRLAYSGGMVGTPSQQPTLDAPGWATMLTGSWANRHQVLSAAPKQVIRGETVFRRIKEKGLGLSGAAVGSTGLADMLSSERDAGFLDSLGDCSRAPAATDCVTTQARQLIAANYSMVFAQYRGAKDAALNYGIRSAEYAQTLTTLDKAVGSLVEAAAKNERGRWLVMVTGNHGLSDNSQDNGLPLLPQSATFVGMNQAANLGTHGVGAALPGQLDDLYAYPSIADIAPTVFAHVNIASQASAHHIDGGALLGGLPVSGLTAKVLNNASSEAAVQLSWRASDQAPVTVLRDGQPVGPALAAGSTSFVDNTLSQVLSARGTYQFNYTVQAGSGAQQALRSIVSPPVTYTPPVPLAASLTQGLVSYYPFSATLPPVDAMGHSVMGPVHADLPPEAGLVVPGPFGASHGLLVDTNYVTTDGLEGYRLVPNMGKDIAAGAAPQFTLGFWFKTPSCVSKNNVSIISNKRYVSGGNPGVAVGLFSSSGNQCGVAFNIGSGGVRADGPTSPYTQIPVNQWVYIAFSVDGVAKSMNMYVYDPVAQRINRVATDKSTGAVDMSKLAAFPHWGIGDDGTGYFLMDKCNGSVKPPYVAGQCATAPTYQQHFGDLAMWNRVLTDQELQSVFLSNKPLSTLLTQ